MLGLQDLLGLPERQGPVLRLVLAREQVQPEKRLPGRGQGPALLDLVQERQVHHHHKRQSRPAAKDHCQDPRVGHRESAQSARTVPLRILGPRQDPHYQCHEVSSSLFCFIFGYVRVHA